MIKRTRFRGRVGQKVHFSKNSLDFIKISFYDEAIKLYSFDLSYHFTEDNLKSLISIIKDKWRLGFNLILKTEKEELYELIELNQKEQT